MEWYTQQSSNRNNRFLFLADHADLHDFTFLKDVVHNTLLELGKEARKQAGLRMPVGVYEKKRSLEYVSNYDDAELADGQLSVRVPLTSLETTLDLEGRYIKGSLLHTLSKRGLWAPSQVNVFLSTGSVELAYLPVAERLKDEAEMGGREYVPGPLLGYSTDCRTGAAVLDRFLRGYYGSDKVPATHRRTAATAHRANGQHVPV